ncbi:hypothetical protein [Hymenobacter chitinivorans]|uniref:Uncharacterized protein n=1 Tax=Hymenobacter chitinivorans DSM 11115 TaxID=1121954 RepID=A0A2M9BMR8_9BACT|nr:hypothetical protein [Hymenobacter chitinivorans]PJJ59241.1 hypothetical protein CLV45_0657 [Hymenobacter chitinivorans DSM 11115]
MQKLFPVLLTVACALFLLWAKLGTLPKDPKRAQSGHALNIDWQDTLIISAQGNECGEFGGNREVIRIYLDTRKAQQEGLGYDKTNQVPRVAAWWRDTLCPKHRPGARLFLAATTILSTDEEAVVLLICKSLCPIAWQAANLSFMGTLTSFDFRLDREASLTLSYLTQGINGTSLSHCEGACSVLLPWRTKEM